MTSRQYATFEVDHHLLGLDVAHVQEVLSHDHYTPVPLAPPTIAGLFNLRGQVIAAIDLRTQLGLPAHPTARPTMNVIIRTATDPISLLVDRIGEVIELPDHAHEPPPDTLTGPARHLITGAFKLEDRLLLTLDTSNATNTSQELIP